MIRRVAHAVVALALAAALAVSGNAPASAAGTDDESDATITWSVRPGDETGADGRSWIELELDPGARVTEHLVVTNHSPVDVEFRLSAADGYFTDKGRFNMLASDVESTEAGTWIAVPDSVEVPSGESVVVPFTLTVPDNATPGDHPAGVAASILSSGDGQIGVESRVGFRVMTRVTGELEPAIRAEATGEYAGVWNPFEPGVLTAGILVENTGNTRLGVLPTVTATSLFGLIRFEQELEEIAEIAPGEQRSMSADLRGVWPLFAYDVSVEATPVAVSEDLPVDGVEPASASTTVMAIPVSQLIFLAIAAVLILLFWLERRRKKRDLDRRLTEAREAGRQEAATGTGGGAALLFVGAVVGVLLLGAPAPAFADAAVDNSDGVSVHVEILPRETGPSPSPSTPPSPSPSPSSPGGAVGSDPDDLAGTGGSFDAGLLLVGAGALAGGVALVVAARAARRSAQSARASARKG